MQTLIVTFISLVVALNPESLTSQATIIDEGTFIIEIEGRIMGTESFKIRSAGSGAELRTIAQGDLVLSTDKVTETVQSALGTLGPTMSIQAYQTRILPSNLEINLQRRNNRLIAITSSDLYVEEREYRRLSSRTPTIILDQYFAHHYFLVLPHQFTESEEITAVFPRTGEQIPANLSLGLVEPISLGDTLIQAQYMQLNVGGVIHRIWTDGQNRILRVEIPEKDYVAYRSPVPEN
tara:strand:+ start:125 stop:832 length:708 start_codon:yes stop_codon:yes gene_type:complete